MRYLGADPTRPADDIERLVSIHLHNRVLREQERAARRAR